MLLASKNLFQHKMKKALDEPLFVFSLLHSESLECMKLCIRNFKMFASKGDKLIINSSVKHGYEHDVSDADVQIVRGAERKAHGADLLQGHMQNWRMAVAQFGADQDFIFVTMASNSMFYRAYNKLAVLASMGVSECKSLDAMSGWQYESIRKSESFLKAFGPHYLHNQIEGFTTWSSSWQAIERKFNELEYNKHTLEKQICLEEVLPLAVLSGNKLKSTNLCRMKWAESKQGRRFVTPHDLWIEGRRQPAQVCMYKWFDREAQSLISKMVSEELVHKSFSALYDQIEQIKPAISERLELARSFLDEVTMPRSVIDVGSHHFSHSIDHSHDRKVIRINEGLGRSPFIYMESLPQDFSAQLTIEMAGGRVSISSVSDSINSKPNASAYYDLKFYLALYIPIPEDVEHLYLTNFRSLRADNQSANSEFSNNEMVLNFGVIEHKGKYEVMHAHACSFDSSFLKPFAYYNLAKTARAGVRCFGVPIIPNTGFSFEFRGA